MASFAVDLVNDLLESDLAEDVTLTGVSGAVRAVPVLHDGLTNTSQGGIQRQQMAFDVRQGGDRDDTITRSDGSVWRAVSKPRVHDEDGLIWRWQVTRVTA